MGSEQQRCTLGLSWDIGDIDIEKVSSKLKELVM
jgi:hypothetical protein